MVQLKGEEEGLMIDTGALGNLMGSSFFNRVKMLGAKFQLYAIYSRMMYALGVEGVGMHKSALIRGLFQ